MFMKKQIVGFLVLVGISTVFPKPEDSKKVNYESERNIIETPVETVEDKQSFDEYMSNTIIHFVDSGTDTPSPWYNDETDVMKDGILEDGPTPESPWTTEDGTVIPEKGMYEQEKEVYLNEEQSK